MAMMQLFRKFRVWGVSTTLFFFVTVFIPGQAKANPLALVPIALIGTALTGAALVGGSYYAPAVYDAGQLAASSAGNVARQVYYGQKFLNSVAGDYFYGKAVSLVAHVGDFIDYLRGIAGRIPALWNQILAASDDSTYNGLPYAICSGTSATLNHLPCSGGQIGTACYYRILLDGSFYTNVALTTTAYTSTAAISGLCDSVSLVHNQVYYDEVSDQFKVCWNLANKPGYHVIYYTGVFTTYAYNDDLAVLGEFSPADFPLVFTPSADVAADIDTLANDEAAPPGLITPADTAIPSDAAGGTVTAPPAALTPSDINRGIDAINADISKKAADTAEQIAATDPTNTVAQQNAADAARRAAQDALKAENEVPELPDISATSEPAYTLPEVDFAARFQTFLSNIKSSSVFAMIDNLNLPIGTGQSLISFDFGSWGGVQSLDFADYADAWLILRGVFFAVFCFIATRIVILKR